SSFVFYCSRDHRYLHSFPTRRSSDLAVHLHTSILPAPQKNESRSPSSAAELQQPKEGLRSRQRTAVSQLLRRTASRFRVDQFVISTRSMRFTATAQDRSLFLNCRRTSCE